MITVEPDSRPSSMPRSKTFERPGTVGRILRQPGNALLQGPVGEQARCTDRDRRIAGAIDVAAYRRAVEAGGQLDQMVRGPVDRQRIRRACEDDLQIVAGLVGFVQSPAIEASGSQRRPTHDGVNVMGFAGGRDALVRQLDSPLIIASDERDVGGVAVRSGGRESRRFLCANRTLRPLAVFETQFMDGERPGSGHQRRGGIEVAGLECGGVGGAQVVPFTGEERDPLRLSGRDLERIGLLGDPPVVLDVSSTQAQRASPLVKPFLAVLA